MASYENVRMRRECIERISLATGRQISESEASDIMASFHSAMDLVRRQDPDAWMAMGKQERIDAAADLYQQSRIAEAEKIKQPTDPVMTYVSERYGEYDNDSVRDEKRYYFAQLADLIDTDKARFEQTGRNTFKGDIEFENYKVNLNIASASDDLKNFSGLVSVANKQWNSRETYKFDAQILDKYNTNLKLCNIVDGSEAEEYLIHRNFDGQLFAIDKTNNSVTVLNKAFWEEVRQKEAEIKDKQKDKDDMIALIAISAFSIFAGYIFGIKAGQARKINKNANTKN